MKIPEGLLKQDRCLGTLHADCSLPALDDNGIRSALLAPVWPAPGGPTVFDVVEPGETVCMVIPDQTRRAAMARVIPIILDELTKRDCSESDIFFLVASGIHRHPTMDEVSGILGLDAETRFPDQVFFHEPDNPDELESVGTTRRGHEVFVNRHLLEADRLVVFGTAAYHYHAGFGGGRKSIVPGLASRDTIAHNHSLTLAPDHDAIAEGVEPGRLDGNPVAESMFEAACFCRPDIIINTVLSPAGDLVGVFSGDLDAAHRAACRLVERVCRVDMKTPADLVIASAGDAPNWVQSHKALFNAHRAMAHGGCVVLEAPCPEGLGDEGFRRWIRKADPVVICRELRASVEILGQTALSTLTRGRDTILVTGLNTTDAADLGIETAPDIRIALEKALGRLSRAGRKDPSWCLFPEARHLLPFTG